MRDTDELVINGTLGESLKKIVRGSGIVFTGTLLGMTLAFLGKIIVIRYLTTSEFGLLSLGIVIIGIVGALASIGIPLGVTRYISYFRGQKDNERIWGTIFASLKITAIVSLIFVGIILFLSNPLSRLFRSPDLSYILKILAFCIPFTTITTVLIAIFRGFERVEVKVYFSDLLINLLNISLFAVVILLGLALGEIVYMILASSLLAGLVLIVYAIRKLPEFIPKTKPSSMGKELLYFSLPLWGSLISGTIMLMADTLMLGYFKT